MSNTMIMMIVLLRANIKSTKAIAKRFCNAELGSKYSVQAQRKKMQN